MHDLKCRHVILVGTYEGIMHSWDGETFTDSLMRVSGTPSRCQHQGHVTELVICFLWPYVSHLYSREVNRYDWLGNSMETLLTPSNLICQNDSILHRDSGRAYTAILIDISPQPKALYRCTFSLLSCNLLAHAPDRNLDRDCSMESPGERWGCVVLTVIVLVCVIRYCLYWGVAFPQCESWPWVTRGSLNMMEHNKEDSLDMCCLFHLCGHYIEYR